MFLLFVEFSLVISDSRRKKKEGSSARDSVADVTDVRKKEEGRRKKEEAIKSIVSAINNVLTAKAVAILGISY
ncbi:hypothetical protein QUB08_19935 [Microcoleus sp. BR0-C5]|uniref:hypothetical protein n=1 Tax=Microcoleus sp. BR0-C5 TaxID=2818713 RepID=UPI002FD38426